MNEVVATFNEFKDSAYYDSQTNGRSLRTLFTEVYTHYMAPISRQKEEIIYRFYSLLETWKTDVQFTSSVYEMAMHPAYQEIIGMGKEVLPLILNELQINNDHWYWALRAITGENPVKEEHRGNIKKMKEDWIVWGIENQHI